MPAGLYNIKNPRLGQDIFEARLTDALLARGLVTVEGLQEALRQQVVLGGHLATNLWELHLVDGKELSQLSTEILNVPLADPKEVGATPPEVRRVFTRDLIEQLHILPIRILGSVLQVATAEPWDLLTLGRAAYHCGYPVEPFFLAEVPLAALMEKVYGIPTTARFWFGVQTNERRAQKLARGEVESEEEIAARRSVLLSFVSSEVAKLRRGRVRRPPSAAETAARERLGLQTAWPPPVASDAGPRPAARDTSTGAAAVEEVSVFAGSPPAFVPAESPMPQGAAPGERLIVQPLSHEQAAAIEELPQPIATLAEAMAALDAAEDRDAVGSVLLRFALSKGKRVIVFVRRALLWAGWLGAGEGVDVLHLHTLLMPTAPGTLFGLVASTGAHYIGPLAPHPSYAPFLAALGGGRPRTAALLPVHFHGRLVFGVYLDAGPQKRVTNDIGELIVLAQRLPGALERLLERRLAKR